MFGPERQSVINGTSSSIAFIDASNLLTRLAKPGSMAWCEPGSLVPTLRAGSFSSSLGRGPVNRESRKLRHN
jgi:hypothetical protein